MSPTIETIQSAILLTQFMPAFPQTTNFSASQSLLLNSARILQLHKLDSHRECKRREQTGFDTVDLEIKRRVWWSMVSTDWYTDRFENDQT